MVFDESESIISLLEEMNEIKLTPDEKGQVKTIINAYTKELSEGSKLFIFSGIEIGLKLYQTILELKKDRES